MFEQAIPDKLLYLDTYSAAEFAQAYKQQSYELLQIQDSNHVLDVGCGPGDDVRAMAKSVGDSGKVVGVDNDEAMIAEARRRAEGTGLPLEFHLCDVHQLAFDDNFFDCCRESECLCSTWLVRTRRYTLHSTLCSA